MKIKCFVKFIYFVNGFCHSDNLDNKQGITANALNLLPEEYECRFEI